ncbi:MAG: hypothetical protein A2Y02_03080 [Omnitrophica bacterium GWA2_52_12]|nr:MAG: hypothetical protein A2Y02_03080 [Omnitrophica bacterium GWA2_52_12]
MIRAATHYSKERDPRRAAEIAVHGALRKAHLDRADFALVFAHPAYAEDYPLILERIAELTGTTQISGCSAFGVMTEDADLEDAPALGVLVAASDTCTVSTHLIGNLQESNYQAGMALGSQIQTCYEENRLLCLFPDPYSFHGGAFFSALEQQAGFLPAAGGGASDNGVQAKGYSFGQARSSYDALGAMLLSGNFRYEAGIAHSCVPIGEALQITNAHGNKIFELDHRPAYDSLLEMLSGAHLNSAREIPEKVFLGLALGDFQTEFGHEDYFVSKIMDINTRKGFLTSVVPVRQGGFMTFALRDRSQASQRLAATLEELAQRFEPGKAAFGLYFNCVTRGKNLFGEDGHDRKLIRRYFPDMPVLGFTSYGQFAPVRGVNFFHHQTGTLLVIGEK